MVDVRPDGFDWWNAVVGTAGILIALAAIWIAVRADRKADRVVVDERRRIFELEILRELLQVVEDPEIGHKILNNHAPLARHRLKLDLLTPTRLSYWEALIDAPDAGAAVQVVGLGAEHVAALTERDTANQGREDSWAEFSQLRDWSLFSDGPVDPVRLAELEAYREGLQEAEQGADARRLVIEREAMVRIRERLAEDVRQAMWARVEARKQGKLTWLNNYGRSRYSRAPAWPDSNVDSNRPG